jgi:hypothetical protein
MWNGWHILEQLLPEYKNIPQLKLKQVGEVPSNANWQLCNAIQTSQILGSQMDFNYSKEN